jgi:hypothetical protein
MFVYHNKNHFLKKKIYFQEKQLKTASHLKQFLDYFEILIFSKICNKWMKTIKSGQF